MPSYSAERKAAILKNLLHPHNMGVAEVSESEGVGHSNLYNWRLQAKERGMAVPGSGKTCDSWTAEARFAVVIEAASINASQLSEYYRTKGLWLASGNTPIFKANPVMLSGASKKKNRLIKTKSVSSILKKT